MSKEYCDKCGGLIDWDYSRMLLSMPPQHKGACKNCGEVHYEFCDKATLLNEEQNK
jgi:hypothetical protein